MSEKNSVNTTETSRRYSAPALEKGLDILEALSSCSQGYSLNELSIRLNRSVNEIFRMVSTLHHREYIQISENDRYTLTLKMFELAHRQDPIKALIQEAIPLLTELAERSMQSCHLALYQNGRVIVMAQCDSPERWSFGLKTGALIGLTDTSSGHVLLAFADEITRARMLNHHVKVDGEVALDPGQLFSILETVRSQGYATMPSAQIMGVTNIAMPIRGLGAKVCAAINVPHIARIDGLRRPDIEQIKNNLLDITTRLSKKMGHSATDTIKE
ncbi:IclR family transcriptional regulator [Paenalcaligenes niemegkensis]|uniref:IclR family transcriptional regulator n=1 Tax=Paenalcaligenes niemegkensis TaxID=2895469 RepID=UPI001EE801E9|nr:IclR family transcriptional regulator [Paenalcaligenes niemegkensis]MCQ9618073.1 IclR family transcriptional regulator [Paenalcaligenes niemegkensis]